ncbi:MAG: prepilin-type N-terminal cleavage/methylation domain-containing protein [Myxococcota bacterium]|nr:prepilin-type N-terminal cleavage/methylation domain-containing protein [Myxococcota bacterium]
MLLRSRRSGFTLVEVLIATALLGFALVVMFGLHNQSVRSNVTARKVTDCTYLSQSKMEELLATEWTSTGGRSGTDLASGTSGVGTRYGSLYHPSGGSDPTAVNSTWEQKGSESAGRPEATYFITWEVEDNSTNGEWVQIWVRCAWDDRLFLGTGASKRHGMTISSYKFVDDGQGAS